MHGLTRAFLPLSLLLLACGPGDKNTDTTAETTADTTDTTATASVGDTTATSDAPTTGEPPVTSSTSLETTAGPDTTTGEPVECPPDDGLPPEGSACPMEGQTCSGFVDPCTAFVEAICQDGVWMHVESEPGPDCEESCEPFPSEGEACKVEGASCSTGCENQCQFCNILFCEAGTWQNAEVFPAPCLDCDPLCDFTIQPMCAAGPPDKDACVAGCTEALAGRCEIAFADLRACAGEMPTFVCDAEQRPLVEDCEDQFAAYYACAGL